MADTVRPTETGGEVRHLVFFPTRDQELQEFVEKWIREHNGKISLDDLAARVRKRFGVLVTATYDEQQWKFLTNQTYPSYRLQDGWVSFF